MTAAVLVDGRFATQVKAADRGFQYGDGVFSTLNIRNGVPVFLDYHLDRLQRDCERLMIPDAGRAALLADIGVLMAVRPTASAVLKIQITRGEGGRGYRVPDSVTPSRILALYPTPDYPEYYAVDGVEIRYCSTRLGINPRLAGIKHMNRLEQVLARSEWPPGLIAEGLMLDVEGRVTEGTMSNLFIVRSGRIFTPFVDQCGVFGVMRRVILEMAPQAGFCIEEQYLWPAELDAADEVFLTNSIIGIWPVRRLESRDYKVGPITRGLSAWLTSTIQENINPVA